MPGQGKSTHRRYQGASPTPRAPAPTFRPGKAAAAWCRGLFRVCGGEGNGEGQGTGALGSGSPQFFQPPSPMLQGTPGSLTPPLSWPSKLRGPRLRTGQLIAHGPSPSRLWERTRRSKWCGGRDSQRARRSWRKLHPDLRKGWERVRPGPGKAKVLGVRAPRVPERGEGDASQGRECRGGERLGRESHPARVPLGALTGVARAPRQATAGVRWASHSPASGRVGASQPPGAQLQKSRSGEACSSLYCPRWSRTPLPALEDL